MSEVAGTSAPQGSTGQSSVDNLLLDTPLGTTLPLGSPAWSLLHSLLGVGFNACCRSGA